MSNRERRRILAEYRRRSEELPADFYALWRPANLFLRHGQQRALLRGLGAAGLLPLAGRRILEVGCGNGDWLRMLADYGAGPGDLYGVELDLGRSLRCTRRLAGTRVINGDAAALPLRDDSYDLVVQSTMFSSILDPEVRKLAAAEMLRVLRVDGCLIWYDFFVNNPSNPNVRGMDRRELQRLFPACPIRRWRVTLAPPLTRRLVNVSWFLCAALESLRCLNTHYLAVVRKQSRA